MVALACSHASQIDMVIFVVTKEGFRELEPVIKTGNYPVWIGGDVLSASDLDDYRKMDLDITNFSFAIDPADEGELDNALETIAEHHPGERVFRMQAVISSGSGLLNQKY